MISSSREREFEAKEEGETDEAATLSKPPSSSSRQWSAFRNPRIVRVSRSFGGKDRHSKVCTIRGLRDRRIRLSVPTAVQLYDLQDRLGLGQPSKVIDWLLDNTKDDIDKLPPLPIPQGFGQLTQFHHQPMVLEHSSSATQSSVPAFDSRLMGININRGVEEDDRVAEASLKLKNQEIGEKGKWISGGHGQALSAQNLFPSSSRDSSFPGNLMNSSMSGFYANWDASNLSLSQYGNHGFHPQTDPSGSQLFFCPPATSPAPFPPYITGTMENESRETNHFSFLGSNSQNLLTNSRTMKPFSLNPGLFHSHNSGETHHDKQNNS